MVPDPEQGLDHLGDPLRRPQVRGPPVGRGAAEEDPRELGELLRREFRLRPPRLPPPEGLRPPRAELPGPEGHRGAAHPVLPHHVGLPHPRRQVRGGGEAALLQLLPRQDDPVECSQSHAGG